MTLGNEYFMTYPVKQKPIDKFDLVNTLRTHKHLSLLIPCPCCKITNLTCRGQRVERIALVSAFCVTAPPIASKKERGAERMTGEGAERGITAQSHVSITLKKAQDQVPALSPPWVPTLCGPLTFHSFLQPPLPIANILSFLLSFFSL